MAEAERWRRERNRPVSQLPLTDAAALPVLSGWLVPPFGGEFNWPTRHGARLRSRRSNSGGGRWAGARGLGGKVPFPRRLTRSRPLPPAKNGAGQSALFLHRPQAGSRFPRADARPALAAPRRGGWWRALSPPPAMFLTGHPPRRGFPSSWSAGADSRGRQRWRCSFAGRRRPARRGASAGGFTDWREFLARALPPAGAPHQVGPLRLPTATPLDPTRLRSAGVGSVPEERDNNNRRREPQRLVGAAGFNLQRRPLTRHTRSGSSPACGESAASFFTTSSSNGSAARRRLHRPPVQGRDSMPGTNSNSKVLSTAGISFHRKVFKMSILVS